MTNSQLLPIINKLGISLTPVGEKACYAYEALLGVENWESAEWQPIHAQRVLQNGWPLAILSDNASLNGFLNRKRLPPTTGRTVSSDDWSVIHAGAILKQLGVEVEFVAEVHNKRTPDLYAYVDQSYFYVEVTSGNQRNVELKISAIVELLTSALHDHQNIFHSLIYLGEDIDTVDLSEILEAVTRLQPGQEAGQEKAWHLYAIPLDQESAIIDPSQRGNYIPRWWVDDGPTRRSSAVALSQDITARLEIAAKLSPLSYINSVRRKAERYQGDYHYPFVIAIEQLGMPLRHSTWVKELECWLPMWPHVSAVICFDRRPFMFSKFCWHLSAHLNQNAKHKLPNGLTEQFSEGDFQLCVEIYDSIVPWSGLSIDK